MRRGERWRWGKFAGKRWAVLAVAALTLAPGAARASEDGANGKPADLIPADVKPDSILTERELQSLTVRLARQKAVAMDKAPKLDLPVTRVRVIVALVKASAAPETIDAYKTDPPSALPPDMEKLPLWARPYVAFAVDARWLPADVPVNGALPATWRFAGSIVERAIPGKPGGKKVDVSADEDAAYTGLIVNAGGTGVQRAMSPRILDDKGEVIYPDPKHIPDLEFVQDEGVLIYAKSVEEAARSGKRVGKTPLIVTAVSATGPGKFDVVVNADTAERIRKANAHTRFLFKWQVCIVAEKPDAPKEKKEPEEPGH